VKARRSTSRKSEPAKEANDLDAVLESVRSIWAEAEKADPPVRDWVTKKITEGILRLRQQVQGRLRLATLAIPRQQTFFQPERPKPAVKPPKPKTVDPPVTGPRFPEPVLRVYAKDLASQALQQLPKVAECKSIDELRKHLIDNLRFNSEATRRRNANYLIGRFFPGDVLNTDLPQFAAITSGTHALGEALFYLTCRIERIVAQVADQVVFPSLAVGGIARTKIRDFIQAQLPSSKSANQVGVAVVNTYHTFGIGKATRTRLDVSLREGCLVSFAYILHMEFPEPGMYSFERMFDGPMHKWLLWDQQWMVQQLYRLREAGVLSKVSEIDRLRQFTTKFTLAEAMQPIVALAKESPE
jgi:DNA repair protein RadC